MAGASAPRDLTDAASARLAPRRPRPAARGRRRVPPWRVLLEGMVCGVRTGCPWLPRPREYPPWQPGYRYVRRGRRAGTGARLHAAPRGAVREPAGRDPQPSGGGGVAQSVETTSGGGPRGDAGGKKGAGRQRHLLVDPLGLVLRAAVHPADRQARPPVPQRLAGADRAFPRLSQGWGDQGSTGRGRAWIERELGWTVAVGPHPPTARGA